jgi:ubiquinol-cytochrome c reductase core subunit 2
MQHFASQLFSTNRAAVAGVGIDHNLLVPMAQNLNIESGAGPESPKSGFHQSEIRLDSGIPIAVVALATEGAGLVRKLF